MEKGWGVVQDDRDARLVEILKQLAPGTALRDGIERIIGAERGALLVLGDREDVLSIATGGFAIDTEATGEGIAELAKMDGAIILDDFGTRIIRANVHLNPEREVPTTETGTRHRTAERVARQLNVPVLSVSESMGRVTLYWGDLRHIVDNVSSLLFKANQALSTLGRYRARLDEVTAILTSRELEDAAVLRDVVVALQRAELVRRIAREVEEMVLELGTQGRLIRLQHDELMSHVDEERELIVKDYLADRRRTVESVLATLDNFTSEEVLRTENVASALSHDADAIDRPVKPRGHRLLARVPRLPDHIVTRLVDEFGSLRTIMDASLEDLVRVEGVGETRAERIQDALRRRAEAQFLRNYH